jgi:hypothetical protein
MIGSEVKETEFLVTLEGQPYQPETACPKASLCLEFCHMHLNLMLIYIGSATSNQYTRTERLHTMVGFFSETEKKKRLGF